MNSPKTLIAIFAGTVLILALGVLALGNKSGTSNAKFSIVDFEQFAAENELNVDQITQCVDEGRYNDIITTQAASGRELGVTGTPGVVLISTQTGLAIMVSGAYPFEVMNQAAQALLAGNVAVGDVVYENSTQGISLKIVELPNLAPVTETDMVLGNPQATLQLIEYSDLECPFCARFQGTGYQLMQALGDNIVWVFRHFPLQSHPTAFVKAQTVECVREQKGTGVAWSLVDTIYARLLQQ